MADMPVDWTDYCVQQMMYPPAIIWVSHCPLAGPLEGNGWRQVQPTAPVANRPPSPPPSPPTPPSPPSPPSHGCKK